MWHDNYEAAVKSAKEILNNKYKQQGDYITLLDVYEHLGIDTPDIRRRIFEGTIPNYAWRKGEFGFVASNGEFVVLEKEEES